MTHSDNPEADYEAINEALNNAPVPTQDRYVLRPDGSIVKVSLEPAAGLEGTERDEA
jgi:hypothetical protein